MTSACKKSDDQEVTITYGLTLAPSGIDPHLNASAELGIPLSSVYDTLVFQDPESGTFIPGLAKSWTISDDGLTYTFKLREDVIFHDGTDFNAEAVEANFQHILNPDHVSQKAIMMLGPIARVEVLEEFSIAIQLHEAFAPLLDSLAQVYLGMASPAALEEWGPEEYQFHQVGTGPYRFVEYIPNDHLTLEKNNVYAWGPSIYNNNRAEIDRINFQFYEDPATRSLALESGEVDILGEVPPYDAARLESTDEFNLYPVPIPGQPLQLFFNTLQTPSDDRLIRQALIQALDREFIVETIFGSFSPVAEGPLSASTMGFSPDYTYPNYDPDKAQQTLHDLGWVIDGSSGFRKRDGESLQLNIVVPPWGSNPEVGQLIRAAWENIGVEVNLEVAPGFGPLKQSQDAGTYHAIGLNFFGTDPDLLRSFFLSTAFYNWSGYQDPDLDALLTSGVQSSLDSDLRQTYYDQALEIIRDQAIIIPIRDYVNLVVARSNIQNLRFSSQGWFPFLIDLSLAQ